MREDYFDFRPTHKLLLSGNHKPILRNVDEAIRRRIHLVPFTVTIPGPERDAKLPEKLRAEWPGILRWMVEGCLEWQRVGLSVPEVVRKATDEYMSDNDQLGMWIEEKLSVEERDAFTLSRGLFASWRAWCESRNVRPGTETAFVEGLKDRGYEKVRKHSGMGFNGIALKQATLLEED
jgi:putative DNA primase/helicase